ncbi:hypothetical protein OSG_eHP1_00185 [environmental Halophage eHP-1]|nr:hypothetical protein OSG_eHP1_00185 [environmental Halophage eHP-1]AFH22216.1 hypothetical protein OSG_eHP19_00055 [environmental Halophage eHP-19]
MSDLEDFDPDGGSSTNDSDTPDADKVVERRDVGASVSVDITRGTGTRDQEKWSIKGKGRNADAAIAELTKQLEEIVGVLSDDEPMASQARSFQPSNAPGDDE